MTINALSLQGHLYLQLENLRLAGGWEAESFRAPGPPQPLSGVFLSDFNTESDKRLAPATLRAGDLSSSDKRELQGD